MNNRAFYSSTLESFLKTPSEQVIGQIAKHHTQRLEHAQTFAWEAQVIALQCLKQLDDKGGQIYFEFLIPRMGKRADVVFLYRGIIFVIEFKIGSSHFHPADVRQAHGYALDLKNFHKGSHNRYIVPLLVATSAKGSNQALSYSDDLVAAPLLTSGEDLCELIESVSQQTDAKTLEKNEWASSGYLPTPTIIEAAQALYADHAVQDIARNEADTQNLGVTSKQLLDLIHQAKVEKQKLICFVTGVPGAGKTLVGLNIANTHSNPKDNEYSVFLSGNGPLVTVLQEALAMDKSSRQNITKAAARRETSQFIQNIHRFRDEALDGSKPPEKVTIFDEAQRAWDAAQASAFMQRKRNQPNFNKSEPEFLIEVMDRHQDWAVIIALIGGGQEINTGEAGLDGWLDALEKGFPHWKVYCSEQLLTGEYVSNGIDAIRLSKVQQLSSLHLATSMRSFRAEKLSSFVHHVIAGRSDRAYALASQIHAQYPLFVTRKLSTAKSWLRSKSRANESKGLLASSNGIRLKAEGIFVKNKFDPSAWFLNDHDDIRSCHFLEDVATEFDIQGLELDWCLVGWDADYRHNGNEFEHWKFKGTKWQRRRSEEDKRYLENAYRVLLTRARQGMIVFVPKGNDDDMTRPETFYNSTFDYLISCGFKEI
ncbi:hypothetical protein A1OO_03265 [Enterovibrio norvegicus FF-33]|uniref:DUF2075 domain-containing protein n=1 Tax=Enterovibrio norvegicus TaxID=188144 RepID=UPI0002F3FBC4|nr:DUF2075 domain-containing protein [Enterovibrio norvegicus]OEE69814.1 hypothetical protein A1OO_03265 [Enterovibrio norvegicus FF-33]OEE85722.1 hypothetical protein A1OQ_17815 [Enterovibrio norvegicus FF-162]